MKNIEYEHIIFNDRKFILIESDVRYEDRPDKGLWKWLRIFEIPETMDFKKKGQKGSFMYHEEIQKEGNINKEELRKRLFAIALNPDHYKERFSL